MESRAKRKRRRFHEYPEEVRKKWIRIKVIPIAHKLARFYMRPWLLITERPRAKAMEGAFKEVTKQTLMCEKEGYESTLVIFNIALYLLIAERDISTVKIDALTHPDPWKRNLCLRIILLTLHEWDMDKVTGSRLKKAFGELKISELLQKETFEALRSVRKVQEKAKKAFGDLRNATIAHRDPNALLQSQAIQNIDTKEVLKIAMEFYEGAEKFISIVPKLIIEAGAINALLIQKLNQAKLKN